MKKMTVFVLACVLTFCLAQCKKEQPENQNSEVNTIHISVRVGNGSSKANVDPTNGKITFTNGDVLYVGYNKAYVGSLLYNSVDHCFSGSLDNNNLIESESQPLHFYYLGNQYIAYPTFTSEQCTVDIGNQKLNESGYYPVISYGTSDTDFSSGATSYTTTLYNKCALVKFNVSSSSTSATRIMGMNNLVTVNFVENTISYSQKGNGAITLSAGNGEKWAILLPQDAKEAGEIGSAFSDDGWYKGTRGAIPAIENNDYLTNGISVEINTEVEVPEGALHGMFSINRDGDKVFFSKGNLQYIGSASIPYWKFADNQWDRLISTTGQNSANQSVDRDLFGWGTSGNNHGSVCYRPWSTSQTNSDYYAYGQNNYNLYDQTGMADWGVNPISNGGNVPNQWRTLSKDEWDYVLNSRKTASGVRYAKARLTTSGFNTINGIIIVPDDWSTSYYGLSITNNSGISYDYNQISASDWETRLEPYGAVFLPAAYYRDGTTINTSNTLGMGYYWSSSYYDDNQAYMIRFGNSTMGYSWYNRYYGQSVRLVRNVE